jgi:hypothetical protein
MASMQPYEVTACRIDRDGIFFVCPFCWTSYKKDGTPTARAKPVMHQHGSAGSVERRVEHRVAHCNKFPDKQYNGFNINITADTVGSE